MSCGCGSSGNSTHTCGTKTSGCENVNTCGNSYKLSVFDWLSTVGAPKEQECAYVEVRFKNDRKGYYNNINKLPLHIGSVVVVESSPGHDIGVVSLTGELVKIQMKKKKASEEQALKIYRVASQQDVENWQQIRNKEEGAKIQARKIAKFLGLEMKITDVEYQGDGTKATFYYTAEGRVDFRQLIKEYAAAFKTKIDMKQIGYRQETAKIGGIGSCGRELCCSSWLTDFRSVNTNAARYQQLSINPIKLAGQCGKLKCCLNYELDSYVDALSDFPSSNTVLETEKGRAFCIKIDVFKKRMWFAYVDNSMAWYDLDVTEVKRLISLNKKNQKTPPLEEFKTITGKDTFETVDLIQENNLNRFEKKKPKFKGKNGGHQNGHQTQNAHQNRKPQANREEGNRENGQAPRKNNNQKRRFPPKKKD